MPKKFRRTKKSVYPMVEVFVPSISDEPMMLPNLHSLPLKVMEAFQNESVSSSLLHEALKRANVDSGVLEVVEWMNIDELDAIFKPWTEASGDIAGKFEKS